MSSTIAEKTDQQTQPSEDYIYKDWNNLGFDSHYPLVSRSKKMKEIFNLIKKISKSNATILIQGETGTGKELIAGLIQFISPRSAKPFVKVNCAALPENLLESELFGHERGAFTGAFQSHTGKFEQADQGTIFLDEIGTIDMKTQVDLLRAIERKEFTRLGGNETITSDFRIICATNTNLEASVKRGDFREDLYYRLQVYTIRIEPLRQRTEDIPELVNYFIQKYRDKMSKPARGITSDALKMLTGYAWPGNVRELENAIERAMVVSKGELLVKKDFSLNQAQDAETVSAGLSLEEVEKKHLLRVLERTRWNIRQSAKILGIDRVTIYKKLKKFGIDRPENA